MIDLILLGLKNVYNSLKETKITNKKMKVSL